MLSDHISSPFHSNQPNVNHPKARLHNKVRTMVTSNNIAMNRMTKRMVGNMGQYGGEV